MKRLIKLCNNKCIEFLAAWLVGATEIGMSNSTFHELNNFFNCEITSNAYRIFSFYSNELQGVLESDYNQVINKLDFINSINKLITPNKVSSWTKDLLLIPSISNLICIEEIGDFTVILEANVTGIDVELAYDKYKEELDKIDSLVKEFATTQEEIIGVENEIPNLIQINNVNIDSLPNEGTIAEYLDLCGINI